MTEPMPILYISGMYAACEDQANCAEMPNCIPGCRAHRIEYNIWYASAIGLEAVRAGWAVINPHKNTAGYQAATEIPYDTWLRMDFALLLVSDAVVFLPSWNKSPGARAEHQYAGEMKIPRFYYLGGGIPDPARLHPSWENELKRPCDMVKSMTPIPELIAQAKREHGMTGA